MENLKNMAYLMHYLPLSNIVYKDWLVYKAGDYLIDFEDYVLASVHPKVLALADMQKMEKRVYRDTGGLNTCEGFITLADRDNCVKLVNSHRTKKNIYITKEVVESLVAMIKDYLQSIFVSNIKYLEFKDVKGVQLKRIYPYIGKDFIEKVQMWAKASGIVEEDLETVIISPLTYTKYLKDFNDTTAFNVLEKIVQDIEQYNGVETKLNQTSVLNVLKMLQDEQREFIIKNFLYFEESLNNRLVIAGEEFIDGV